MSSLCRPAHPGHFTSLEPYGMWSWPVAPFTGRNVFQVRLVVAYVSTRSLLTAKYGRLSGHRHPWGLGDAGPM